MLAVLAFVLVGGVAGWRANAASQTGIEIRVVKPINKVQVLPATSPTPGELTDVLTMTAAAGEYEPASFILKATSGSIGPLELVPSDLSGTAGTIPAANVDVRVVKPWFQSGLAWVGNTKTAPDDFSQVLVPELLLKDDALVKVDYQNKKNYVRVDRGSGPEYVWVNEPRLASNYNPPRANEFPVRDASVLKPVTLDAGLNKQFWVTVLVPQGAPAGNYTGTIALRSGGATLGQVKIALTVLPFDLAASRLTYSVYYRGKLDPRKAAIGSEYRTRDQMKAELSDMVNHGIRNPTIYQNPANEGLFQQVLAMRKSAGLAGQPLYLVEMSSRETYRLKERVRKMVKQAQMAGSREVFIYGKDEATGAALTAQRGSWRDVRDAGGKMFVAGSSGTFETMGDILDLFIHAHKPLPDEAVKWQGIGHKIFNYANPQSGGESPYLFRRNYGVVLWGAGYDGAMPYAYQHCFGSCYNDLDDPTYRDHLFTYPTADGVIDTIAWEGFREAVDDVRYLTTLENAIQAARLSGNQRLAAAAVKAEAYIAELRKTVQPQTASKFTVDFDIDLDAMRQSVVGHIMTLKGY
jgi:hypothetical protein